MIYARRAADPPLLIGCNYLFPLIPAGAIDVSDGLLNREQGAAIYYSRPFSLFPALPPRRLFPIPYKTPPQPSVCININNGASARGVENGIVRRQHGGGGGMRGSV